jgi:hypothetical protein
MTNVSRFLELIAEEEGRVMVMHPELRAYRMELLAARNRALGRLNDELQTKLLAQQKERNRQ